jgi:hypothetical protein
MLATISLEGYYLCSRETFLRRESVSRMIGHREEQELTSGSYVILQRHNLLSSLNTLRMFNEGGLNARTCGTHWREET